ncbi:MAG: tetratricopeptide repeat protein, partial [Candidatus Roseilinea sp.]|uniref:tetratricopeptide repeat protein n=1 Tax=Candidatus Roseilinea sp. TaxID=2838777 RepID=UPI004049FF26
YLQAPAAVIPVLVVFTIAAIVGSIAIITSVNRSSFTTPRFSAGSPYVLDLVVMPFRAESTNDPTCRTLAAELPAQLTESIQKQLAGNATDIRSNIKVWSPTQTDIQAGTTDIAYAAQARDLIANRGADIVLRATVQCDDSQLTVTPQFDIAPAYLQNAPEYQGTHDLGVFSSDILQPNDMVASPMIRRELANRAVSLAMLVQGLAHLARQTPAGYIEASAVFDQITLLNPPPDNQTLAVAHIFAGNSSLRAATGDCGNSLNSDLLEEAIRHYQAALSFEPQAALAYMGLGNAMNLRAFYESGGNAEAAHSYLDMADSFFASALSASVKPSPAILENKVRYGQAQAYIIRREFISDEAESAALLDKAEAAVTEILDEYRAGGMRGPSAASLAAHAYFMMGNIHMARENYEAALFNLLSAAKLAPDGETKSLIAVKTAIVQNQINDFCAAAIQYQIAADNTHCKDDKLNFTLLARDYQIECESMSLSQH